MVSKRNREMLQQDCVSVGQNRYALRKLTVGVASVLLGTSVLIGLHATAYADTVNNNSQAVQTATAPDANQNNNRQSVAQNGQTQPSITPQQAASHISPAQHVNLNQDFKDNFIKTTDTASSLQYADGIRANFNNNQYQSDPVAAAEKIDYNNLTEDQLRRINQYQINLVNGIRNQMGLPNYETNMQLVDWQQGQTRAQEDAKLWGHHPEYLHGAGEDVGAFLINNQMGKAMSTWTPQDFKFKRDPQTHAVINLTPIGAIYTMDDLQAVEFYTDMLYLFEDDGLEANGHGHNLLDWNPGKGTMVALGFSGFHQNGGNGQIEGDQMFSRTIFANSDTLVVAGSKSGDYMQLMPDNGFGQQVIHLIDDTDPSHKINDMVVSNPKGTSLQVNLGLPHGYLLSSGQNLPSAFDFSQGNLPDLTVHVKHDVKTIDDGLANTIFTQIVHYKDQDGNTIASDTTMKLKFHRDYQVDQVTGEKTIGHWQYVKNSLTQTGTQISGLGGPGDEYNRVNDFDSFNIWIPFSVKIPGCNPMYSGLNMAWSLPNGDGYVGGPASEYTVTYRGHKIEDVNARIDFVDNTGRVVLSKNVNGPEGSRQDIKSLLPKGWVLYSGQDGSDDVTLTKGVNAYTFLLGHQLKFVSHLAASDLDLNRNVVRTINIHMPNGSVKTVNQTETLHRDAYVDEVSGQVTYTDWDSAGKVVFAGFMPRVINGYDVKNVPSMTYQIGEDASDLTTDVYYQKRAQKITLTYLTMDGQVVKTMNVEPDDNGLIKLQAPDGYKLATMVNTLTVNGNNDQRYVVTVYKDHQSTEDPNALYLSKTMTRTVTIHLLNGRVKVIKQNVKFRCPIKISADGVFEYGNWQVVRRGIWNNIFVPKRVGYKIVSDGNFGRVNVGLNDENANVNVWYEKD